MYLLSSFGFFFCYTTVAEQSTQCLCILLVERIAILLQRINQYIKLVEKRRLVVDEELCPHSLVQTSHPCEVAEATGTVTIEVEMIATYKGAEFKTAATITVVDGVIADPAAPAAA